MRLGGIVLLATCVSFLAILKQPPFNISYPSGASIPVGITVGIGSSLTLGLKDILQGGKSNREIVKNAATTLFKNGMSGALTMYLLANGF